MFTHHLYTLISSCFISLVTKWDCDSFHSPLYTLVSNNFISLVLKWDCDSYHSPHLHFGVKQFYQFCVLMRLWFISLTISTLSHPTVLWSWCPHPTVLSVWWPNEIVTYFTHFLYTLISNCLVLKWYYNSCHSPPLNVNVTKSQHLFHLKNICPLIFLTSR
jgi:hypothetical protein